MQARLLVAVLLAATVVAAGCTDRSGAGPKGCMGDACPTSAPSGTPGAPPGPTGPGPGSQPPGPGRPPGPGEPAFPNSTYSMAQMLGCREIRVSLEVPLATLRPLVPDAFDILGLVPGVTGSLLIKLFDCERSLDNGSVFGPARFWEVLVRAYPANESWSVEGYLDFYLLESATDSGGFLGFLTNQSVEAVRANISAIQVDVPGGARAEAWSIEAASWAARFQFPHVPDPTPQNLTGKANLWYGAGPFGRLAHERTHVGDSQLTAGELLVTGPSKLGAAMGLPATSYLSDSSRDVDSVFRYEGTWME